MTGSTRIRATAGATIMLAALVAVAGHASCSGGTTTNNATDGGVSGPPTADDASTDNGSADVSADVGDAGPDVGPVVLSDPAIWTSVPGGPCQLYVASTLPDPFPRRAWQSCGNGCRVGPAGLPIATLQETQRATSGGAYVAGDGFVQVNLGFASAYVAQVFRMSDDATVAAAELRKIGPECVFGSAVSDAPLLFTPLGGSAVSYRLGRAQPRPGAPTSWQNSWIADPSISLFRFAFDDGVGFAEYDGSIRILRDADAGAFSLLDRQSASMLRASGRGSLLVWLLWTGSGSNLMGYTRTGGVMTLRTESSSWAVSARLSDERLVWISAQGPDAVNGTYASTQFVWSPVPARPQDVVVTAGPTLPQTSLTRLGDLAVGGDYAAAVGCLSQGTLDCRLYVVQFSTKRLWALRHRPGSNVFAEVMAVTPTEIMVGEDDDGMHSNRSLPRLLRIETAHLDDFAAW